jgi:hypothetical protein
MADNSTTPDPSSNASAPRPLVLWRYVANLYHSPTPVDPSVAPALSLTLHCNTTAAPKKRGFYSRKTNTLSGSPATLSEIKVQEWGLQLFTQEGRAGRASELCAQCPGAGAQCEALVATVLQEQVRETYYSEVRPYTSKMIHVP